MAWSNNVVSVRAPYVLHGFAEKPYRRPADIEEKPELRRRKCVRAHVGFILPRGNVKTEPLHVLRRHYAGEQCARDKAGGWICPHRKAPLGAVPADREGIITCPLHGLRIEAATGKCLPSPLFRTRATEVVR